MKMTLGKKKEDTNNEKRSRISDFKVPREELKEEIKKRDKRSKTYLNHDEKIIKEIHSKPIHYYDYEEEKYLDIDNKFEEKEKKFIYKSSFKGTFNKEIKDGKIYKVEKENCSIELNMDSCNFDSRVIVDNNKAKYVIKEAKKDVDYEYLIDTEKVKENIIINNRLDKYEFEFDYNFNNLYFEISEDYNRLELKRKDNGRTQFYILAPYMYDADGNESDEVYFEIEEKEDKAKLKIIADSNWINSEERKFPIVIDPVLINVEEVGYYYYEDEYSDGLFEYRVKKGNREYLGNPKVFNNGSRETMVETDIIIKKSQLPEYILDSLQFALLELKVKNCNYVSGLALGDGIFHYQEEIYYLNITYNLFEAEDDIVISLRNREYREMIFNNDIEFYPPVLLLEYERIPAALVIEGNSVNNRDYIPGEKFNKEGLVVKEVFNDGCEMYISNDDLMIAPSGSLSKEDEYVTISYDNLSIQYNINVDQSEYYFEDRRGSEGRENVYRLIHSGESGDFNDVNIEYVRLELADGVSDDSRFKGTPLNALSFNKIIKKLIENGCLDDHANEE